MSHLCFIKSDAGIVRQDPNGGPDISILQNPLQVGTQWEARSKLSFVTMNWSQSKAA